MSFVDRAISGAPYAASPQPKPQPMLSISGAPYPADPISAPQPMLGTISGALNPASPTSLPQQASSVPGASYPPPGGDMPAPSKPPTLRSNFAALAPGPKQPTSGSAGFTGFS